MDEPFNPNAYPDPVQMATSYDPTDPGSVRIVARMDGATAQVLNPGLSYLLAVRHWWTGAVRRGVPDRETTLTQPAAKLLLACGRVVIVYGWPSVDAWIGFVLGLNPARLREGPLAVRATALEYGPNKLPRWSFKTEECDA